MTSVIEVYQSPAEPASETTHLVPRAREFGYNVPTEKSPGPSDDELAQWADTIRYPTRATAGLVERGVSPDLT